METDKIVIEDLKVKVRIGTTARERRRFQSVLVSIEIPVSLGKPAQSDCLEDTVNYYEVCKVVEKVVAERPRRLIENLAGDIGNEILSVFGVKAVKVVIKKFILKRIRYVAVQVTTSKKR